VDSLNIGVVANRVLEQASPFSYFSGLKNDKLNLHIRMRMYMYTTNKDSDKYTHKNAVVVVNPMRVIESGLDFRICALSEGDFLT
jgi:hypothetical protein